MYMENVNNFEREVRSEGDYIGSRSIFVGDACPERANSFVTHP